MKQYRDLVWRIRSSLRICAIIGILMVLRSAAAQESPILFGIGVLSCANWTALPRNRPEGDAWLLGFWSGLNLSTKNGGQTIGVDGIIIEVRKVCASHPSEVMYDAAVETWSKMVKSGH